MFINYYELLEINPSASVKEVIKAFDDKAQIIYANEELSPQDKEKLKKLLEAKFILTNPETKELYDNELRRYVNYLKQQQALGLSAEDYVIDDKKLYLLIKEAQIKADNYIKNQYDNSQEKSNWNAKGCIFAFLKGFFLIIGMTILYMLFFKACSQF